ncbi:GIY-YIG nuclease family protein [Bacteroides heparinolyticus]|uniref:GIY-YIG nuclease family protein n=1 Tax=Prevotella heparinolytica TaxID=28113 RepID=UPI0035A1C443
MLQSSLCGKNDKKILENYKLHFQGTADKSTLRKSLGCLMGLKPTVNDIYSHSSKKIRFSNIEEQLLTEWMSKKLQ